MAQASSSRATAAKASLADSLEKYLKSAEEKKTEINSKIDSLIEIANARRQVLLLEIDNEIELVREDVEKKQIALKHFESTEMDIDRNLSGNEARHAMITELCNQINKINLNLPNFKLKWSNGFTRILNKFDLFCQLLIYTESPFELENSNTPIWTADLNCGNKVNEITEAKSVAFDPVTHNIYVGDANGMKILIFNKVGDYVTTLSIGKGPSSIGRMLIHEESIYCYINSKIRSTGLYRLDKSTGELIGAIETRSFLKGLAICDNMVYTSVEEAKHILCSTTDLNNYMWLEIKSPLIKSGFFWRSEVQDMVGMNEQLVMLLSRAERPIQAFDPSGSLLWEINLENYSNVGEAFLCIDKHWNIIITSNQENLLCVYNKQGKRIATVGRPGQCRGDMYYPRGIVLDFDSNLIVCDCKKQLLLQAY